MSYSEDVVLSKLSVLNETQESIVSISQWIMFHKRYAEQSAKIWARFLGNAPANKKLGLIYLANEIVQQSRAKKKTEFLRAFETVLPSSIESTYRVVPSEVKARIKRVVDVWKQRQIFPPEVLQEIENRIANSSNSAKANDNVSGNSSLGLFGAMSGGGSSAMPKELSSLASTFQNTRTGHDNAFNDAKKSIQDYEELLQADNLPAPPIYAKRLAGLLAGLQQSSSALQAQIKARKDYETALKKLLEQSEAEGKEENNLLATAAAKEQEAAEVKQEVESMLVSDLQQDEDGEFKAPSPEPLSDNEDDGYVPQSIDTSAVPSYSPGSSDEEDEAQPVIKKSKVEQTAAPISGLDPAVAHLLSSLGKT